jgi:hypothetical protein
MYFIVISDFVTSRNIPVLYTELKPVVHHVNGYDCRTVYESLVEVGNNAKLPIIIVYLY